MDGPRVQPGRIFQMPKRIDFENALNPEQLEAVTHHGGPQLVLAGAGSGKTRVITYRIAWLVEQGIDPSEIGAVTFTNKAAAEMKERVEELVGVYPLTTFVGTFHRFALRLLRRYGKRIDLASGFAILDTDDQRRLIKQAMAAEDMDDKQFRPQAVLAAISNAKNKLIDPKRYAAEADDFFTRRVAPVYKRYQKLARASNGVDFDDMISLSVLLLRHDGALRDRLRSRMSHLMVDEYQDTNHAQMQLIHELVPRGGDLTAVGDEDQGIYRWRGAELDNILRFEDTFPGAAIRKLEQNYRSTQNILDASGAVVENNQKRRGKRLWTDAGEGDRVYLYRGQDERDEARWVINTLRGLEGVHRLSSMAVLVRTNAQTRALEEELIRQQMDYNLVGGVRFYERAEVKDVIAYLRLLRNPHDNLSFGRILNRPPRGIGKTTEKALRSLANSKDASLWQTLVDDDLSVFATRAAKSLRAFRTLIQGLIDQAEDLPLPALLDQVLDATQYLELYNQQNEDDRARLENLQELLSAAREFTESQAYGSDTDDVLTAFLDHVSLVADTDKIGRQKGVSLMTLHSAKGLEFDAVVMTGLEERILPHQNSIAQGDDAIEEERRLMYVGMTRARKRLYLTTCQRRQIAGQYQDQDTSRFVDEIPSRYLDEERSPQLFSRSTGYGSDAFSYGGGGYGGGGRRGSGARGIGGGSGSSGFSYGSGASASGARRSNPRTARPKAKEPQDPAQAVLGFFGKGDTGTETTATETAAAGGTDGETSYYEPDPSTVPNPLFQAPKPKPKLQSAGPKKGKKLRRGARVRHPKLGRGKIMKIEGDGDDARLMVYFDGVGRRTLVAKYAPLEVL